MDIRDDYRAGFKRGQQDAHVRVALAKYSGWQPEDVQDMCDTMNSPVGCGYDDGYRDGYRHAAARFFNLKVSPHTGRVLWLNLRTAEAC